MQPADLDLLDVDPFSLVDDEEPFIPAGRRQPAPKPRRTARELMSRRLR